MPLEPLIKKKKSKQARSHEAPSSALAPARILQLPPAPVLEDDMFAMALPTSAPKALPPEVANARQKAEPEPDTSTPVGHETAKMFSTVLRQAANAEPSVSLIGLHPIDARRQMTLSARQIKEAKIAKKAERAAANKDSAAVAAGEADNRVWNRRKVEPLPKKLKDRAAHITKRR